MAQPETEDRRTWGRKEWLGVFGPLSSSILESAGSHTSWVILGGQCWAPASSSRQ